MPFESSAGEPSTSNHRPRPQPTPHQHQHRARRRHEDDDTEDELSILSSRLVSESHVDMSSIPREFLQSYPYPALAIICSGAPDLNGVPPTHLPIACAPLAKHAIPVWTNRSWKELSNDGQPLQFLSVDGGRRLRNWLTAPRRFAREPSFAGEAEGSAAAGKARRTDRSVENGDAALTLGGRGYGGLESSSILLDFAFPSGAQQFELTKTLTPIYIVHRGHRQIVDSYNFAVITTVPRDRLPPSPRTEKLTRPSSIPDLKRTAMDNRRRDRDIPLVSDRPLSTPALAQPRALHFSRDGSVTQMTRPSLDATSNGIPLSVEALLEMTDWSKTPFGPRDDWPASLQVMVNFVMFFPHAASIWWGKERCVIYNQRYADFIPSHPYAFGRSGTQLWPELWSSLGPLADIIGGGTPIAKDDDLVAKYRDAQGNLRESYRCQAFVPLKTENGNFGGVFHGTMDTTKRVIMERRSALLREIAERIGPTRTRDDFTANLLDTLRAHPKDAPFALVFNVEQLSEPPKPQRRYVGTLVDDQSSETSTPNLIVRMRYAGGVGVPKGHPTAQSFSLDLPSTMTDPSEAMITEAFSNMPASSATPPSYSRQPSASPSGATPTKGSALSASMASLTMNSETSQPLAWPLQEVLRTQRPLLLEDCSQFIKGYSIRVWNELPQSAILIPLSRNAARLPPSILVLGISSRLAWDKDYEAFISSLRLQLALACHNVSSYQNDVRRLEELAALDRAKNLLFNNVSHELLTPLSLVNGPLDDLASDVELDSPRLQLIKLARRNVRNVTRLVTMLLDLSNLEASQLKGAFRLVNLGAVTRDVANLFRTSVEKGNLSLTIDIDESPRQTFVIREKWEKILFSIIANAVKHTRAGSVHISLRYEGTEAVFAVKDTGIGIPMANLEEMNENFFSNAGGGKYARGTGITLMFINKFIEIHRGQLDVTSATAAESGGEHGSTFAVRIPLGNAHLPPGAVDVAYSISPMDNFRRGVVEQVRQWHRQWEASLFADELFDHEAASVPRVKSLNPGVMLFKRDDVVLVVDSNSESRAFLRSVFAPYCKVVEATDGREALERVDTIAPNLIVIDAILPHVSGHDFVRAMRTGQVMRKTTPIMVLTVNDDRHNDQEGADDYLAKPFNPQELIARASLQMQLGKKRRELESLFDERLQELRLLTDHSPVGIFRCTPEGFVSYVNQSWCDISGYPTNRDVTNWGDYIIPEHQRMVMQIWEGFVSSGHDMATAEWQWTNGRWVSTKVVRLENIAPNAPPGFIGCVIDITERKLNEELQRQRVVEAEQRRVEAEEAKHQQELLIDITSHEIRNPISSLMQCSSLVKTNLQVLQEEVKSALEEGRPLMPTPQLLVTMNEDLDALDSIYQCGLTQERISNDVLSLGKIQLDALQMFDTETIVRKEAKAVLSIFQNEARIKRMELNLNMSPAFDELGITAVMTDPVRLGQVMTNLMSNAVRFTSKSRNRRVDLSLDVGLDPPPLGTCAKPTPSRDTGSVQVGPETPVYLFISVKDTGPGLTAAELELLFQRFSQASAKTHTVYGGSGLGLFVCRKITERLNGRIEVVSEPGQGSEFRFFIKTRPCIKVEDPVPAKRETIHSQLRVLIVEDNHINLRVLSRQLKHVGMDVDNAPNGLAALNMIRQAMAKPGVDFATFSAEFSASNIPLSSPLPASDLPPGGYIFGGPDPPPRRQHPMSPLGGLPSSPPESPPMSRSEPYDCILMDLEMPVMDGYTAASHVRRDQASGKIGRVPIVALTGNARQAQIDGQMADFDDVVVKPYRLDDLLRKIEKNARAIREENEEEEERRSARSAESDRTA